MGTSNVVFSHLNYIGSRYFDYNKYDILVLSFGLWLQIERMKRFGNEDAR